jgi:hypothetical protein
MAQRLIGTVDITPGQPNWDADVNLNFDKLETFFRSVALSISFQGSTGAPSLVDAQLQNSRATPGNVAKVAFMRFRVTDSGSYANATNALLAAVGGTTIVETLTASKDLVMQSDAAGLFELEITDGTAETFTLRIGPAPLQPESCDYDNSQDVTHA